MAVHRLTIVVPPLLPIARREQASALSLSVLVDLEMYANFSLTLRQSRFAQPIEQVLGVLVVLVDGSDLPSVDCKSWLDAPQVVGCGPGVRELIGLGAGRGQPKMADTEVGQTPCAFPECLHRFRIAFQHIER